MLLFSVGTSRQDLFFLQSGSSSNSSSPESLDSSSDADFRSVDVTSYTSDVDLLPPDSPEVTSRDDLPSYAAIRGVLELPGFGYVKSSTHFYAYMYLGAIA